jgi:hypothetical protein
LVQESVELSPVLYFGYLMFEVPNLGVTWRFGHADKRAQLLHFKLRS